MFCTRIGFIHYRIHILWGELSDISAVINSLLLVLAGMVVHPSPGHDRGTLVNALLHHCGLGSISAKDHPSGTPASLQGAQGLCTPSIPELKHMNQPCLTS